MNRDEIIKNMEFVIVNSNEVELIERALLLGINHLCLVYETFDNKLFNRVKKLDLNHNNIELYCAIIVKKISDINTKKYIDFDFIIGDGCKQELFLSPKIDAIINLEIIPKKDSVFQRNSGFNHIFAEECVRTNKMLFFNFNNILKKYNKGQIVGRIFQNYRLCKKYGVKCKLGSFSQDVKDLRNLTKIDLERIWKGY